MLRGEELNIKIFLKDFIYLFERESTSAEGAETEGEEGSPLSEEPYTLGA